MSPFFADNQLMLSRFFRFKEIRKKKSLKDVKRCRCWPLKKSNKFIANAIICGLGANFGGICHAADTLHLQKWCKSANVSTNCIS